MTKPQHRKKDPKDPNLKDLMTIMIVLMNHELLLLAVRIQSLEVVAAVDLSVAHNRTRI
jgi:hypothetical protein